MTATMKFGSRLRSLKKVGSGVTWLLIPGGPGIESDYMASMALQLSIDVNFITFDLPRIEYYPKNPGWPDVVKSWREDLCEALCFQENTVIVGHSFGGMLALSTPELQEHCVGAVFLDSSPSKDWEKHSAIAATKLDATKANKAEEEFAKNPSDEAFKKVCVEWAPFYFLPEFEVKGREVLLKTSYNHFPYRACGEFFKDFRNRWGGWNFPTLCLAGDNDLITPLSLFENDPSFAEQSNVELVEIKKSGHFPWVENLRDFQLAMKKFSEQFANSSS